VIRSLALILVWVSAAAYGDVCFKRAAGVFGGQYLLGCAAYAATTVCAVLTFSRQSFAWVIILWSALSLGVSMAISIGFFKERLTVKRAIACTLLLAAIVLTDGDQ
jgi:multidrug transporter EmrE-like cation transporter